MLLQLFYIPDLDDLQPTNHRTVLPQNSFHFSPERIELIFTPTLNAFINMSCLILMLLYAMF